MQEEFEDRKIAMVIEEEMTRRPVFFQFLNKIKLESCKSL